MHRHEVLRTTTALRGGTTPKEEYIVDEKTQNALEQIAMAESLVLAEKTTAEKRM